MIIMNNLKSQIKDKVKTDIDKFCKNKFEDKNSKKYLSEENVNELINICFEETYNNILIELIKDE